MKPLDMPRKAFPLRGRVPARQADEAATEPAGPIDFSNVVIVPLFSDHVDFETFSKSDLRAVKVLECEAVPKSKKLLKFTLDDGSGTPRLAKRGDKVIYIIRHGQTELNSRKVLQGRSDYPLNESGVEQARASGKKLSAVRFSKVYSSPLKRAVETAEIVSPGSEILVDERLIEMDYGRYEGMDLQALTPEVITFFSDFVHNPAPESMEQLASVVKRAGEFVEERCRTEEDILISTHAIAMKGILEYLTPDSGGSYWSKFIGNCAIYVTEYRDGSFTPPAELT